MTDVEVPLRGADIARLAEREAVARLELLVSVGRLLGDAMEDYHDAAEDVAAACVPDFADLVAIELSDDGEGVETVAFQVTAGSGLDVPGRWMPVGAASAPERRAVVGWGRDDEAPSVSALRSGLGAGSVILAPISAGGVTYGWLVAATGPQRRGFRASALSLAEEVAGRIGRTVQRVMLHRELQTSSREQVRAVRRLRRLAGAATRLAGADTPEAVLSVGCVEACVIQDAAAAAARWVLPSGREVRASAGQVDEDLAEVAFSAATHGRRARGRGWVAFPLPCSDPWQHGVLVVFVGEELSDDADLLLSSLASFIPVAFERAEGTEAAVVHEARLAAVLETSPVALLTIRPNGVVSGANQAAVALFGWEPSATSWSLPEGVDAAVLALVSQVRSTGHTAQCPVVVEGYDLSVSGAPMPEVLPEDARLVIVAATDLRDRHQAAAALLQAQRLEAMGQIAGRVAHDFNNLLTLTIGYTEILRQMIPGETERDMLAKIAGASRRAAALTQQMLGVTRRQLDTAVVLDMAEVLRELDPVLHRLAGARVDLEVAVDQGAVKVRIDPGELEQIILNLAINACDAMEHDGRLSIRLDGVEVGASDLPATDPGLRPGPYARLSVTDDGPGMSGDVLAHCREPFFTTKDRDKGSGLGLPAVYGLTLERGGGVDIVSAPGAGTSVVVWLPREDDRIPVGRGDGPTDWPVGERICGRVLLVEDEGELRELARRTLEEVGAVVIAARHAEEALVHPEVVTGAFDVLVTDIVLPGLSGVELAAQLRDGRADLPVLLMTGYATRATRNQEVLEGAVLLRKPYRPDELRRRIAALLARADQGSKR